MVDEYGYKIDPNFINEIAYTTRIGIKNAPNTFFYGYILYAITCKFLEKYRLGNIYILDITTQKGFNTHCMAKASQDMEESVKIITIDPIPHKEARYWNCAHDEGGKKNRKEFLYVYFTSAIGKKRSPTKKAAVQLTATAIEAAMGLALLAKTSLTRNQGMEPGPVANITTKRITSTMEE